MCIIDKYSKEELENIVKHSFSKKEVLQKIGYSTIGGNNFKTLKKRLELYNINTSHFHMQKLKQRNIENVFCENSTCSQATLRRWYLKENINPYICSICKLPPIWENKELTLILDHVNGKNKDNRIENLRWVCPNCNQQLETTGYTKQKAKENKKKKKNFYCLVCNKEIPRNNKFCKEHYQEFIRENGIKRRKFEIEREDLKKLIRTESFTQIGKRFNVDGNAIKKRCKVLNLPFKKSVIKKIKEEEWKNI